MSKVGGLTNPNPSQNFGASDQFVIGVFGELLTGVKRDDVSVSFKYPFLNTSFDVKSPVLTGDGAAAVANQLLTVSSAANGTATVESKNEVRYRNGHTGFGDFTVSFAGTGTGYAGLFDTNDGFYIKVVNGAASVGRRKGGVEFNIASEDWNGTISPDAITWSNINICRILFGYLGVANTIFQIRLDRWYTLHTLQVEGQLQGTTVNNPSFPIAVRAQNGMSVNTGSWNGGVLDGSDEVSGSRYFAANHSVTLSGTDLATMVTFRNKSTYKGVSNKVKANLVRYAFFIDAPASGVGTVQFIIRKNATLAGAGTWTDVSADNSILEYDTVTAYSSGGTAILYTYSLYSGTIGAGSDVGGFAEQPAQDFGLFLLPNETATITAQNVAGNTNVTCRVTFNWIELW